MKIDPKYIEYGVIEVVDGWIKLTKLGHAYGMALLVNLTAMKIDSPKPLDCYRIIEDQAIENYAIPKHILFESTNSFRFILKGIEWIQGYIEKHEFNNLLFKQSCEIKQGCEAL